MMQVPTPRATSPHKRPLDNDDDIEPSISTPTKSIKSEASTPLSVRSVQTPSPYKPNATADPAAQSSSSHTNLASSQPVPAPGSAQQPAKRRKLTQKEKDDQKAEKEAKAKAQVEKKAQKEAKDKLKEEEKQKRVKEREDKQRQKEEEQHQKEEEKLKKEEEKLKKERVSLGLTCDGVYSLTLLLVADEA
jgi:chromatin assembly factor 1 subunit A